MERVAELALDDDVMYVEPPLPGFVDLNDGNRADTGANIVNAPPYSLDGSGVTVLVYDGGKIFSHADLAGRLTIGQSDTGAISDHSTHVACTIGGHDIDGPYSGMAPGVDIVSYTFQVPGGLMPGFLYTDPGDLEADYTEAISLYGADVANNSIGSNTAVNGYPCAWEGDYGVTSALIDEIVRGSLGSPFRVVWSNGNERGPGTCGVTYHTTAPPSCAKNHLTVGAVNSNDDSMTTFSSWGPCDDGRLKPDVSAPGCESGAGGVTSCISSGGYGVMCGTSMSSPTVAGLAALVLQQYRESYPARPDFRNSLLRALMAHTAVNLGNPGPDYQTGYGAVRVQPAVDTIVAGRFVEAEVAQGDIHTFSFLVAAGRHGQSHAGLGRSGGHAGRRPRAGQRSRPARHRSERNRPLPVDARPGQPQRPGDPDRSGRAEQHRAGAGPERAGGSLSSGDRGLRHRRGADPALLRRHEPHAALLLLRADVRRRAERDAGRLVR